MHWYFFDELARERHQRLMADASGLRRSASRARGRGRPRAVPRIRLRLPSPAAIAHRPALQDLMTTAPDTRSEFTALQDSIAHRVATAFEAGGSTWQMTAPLLEGLVADDVIDGPPVVTARTLGRVLVRQAAAVEDALCNGDLGPADLILARLRTVHHRLAVLGDGHYRFAA